MGQCFDKKNKIQPYMIDNNDNKSVYTAKTKKSHKKKKRKKSKKSSIASGGAIDAIEFWDKLKEHRKLNPFDDHGIRDTALEKAAYKRSVYEYDRNMIDVNEQDVPYYWRFARQQMLKSQGLDDFHILNIIHQEKCSKILHIRHIETGLHYAVRIIDRELTSQLNNSKNKKNSNNNNNNNSRNNLYKIKQIKHISRLLHHPNIVRLAFDQEVGRYTMIFYELIYGWSLREVLENHGILSKKQVRFIAAEIVLALGYLHENNFVFRNISLDSIMIDELGHVKLVGVKHIVRLTKQMNRRKTIVGKDGFKAPEMLDGDSYSFGIDWWNFGILLYCLLTSKHPFIDKNILEMSNIDVEIASLKSFKIIPNELVKGKILTLIEELLNPNIPERFPGNSRQAYKSIQQHIFFTKIDWFRMMEFQQDPKYIPELPEYEADKNLLPLYADLEHAMDDLNEYQYSVAQVNH